MDRLRNTGDDNNQNNDYLQHDDDHQGLSLLVELADQSWALPTNFAVPDTLDNLIRISILGMNSVADLVRGPSVCWTGKNVSPLYGTYALLYKEICFMPIFVTTGLFDLYTLDVIPNRKVTSVLKYLSLPSVFRIHIHRIRIWIQLKISIRIRIQEGLESGSGS